MVALTSVTIFLIVQLNVLNPAHAIESTNPFRQLVEKEDGNKGSSSVNTEVDTGDAEDAVTSSTFQVSEDNPKCPGFDSVAAGGKTAKLDLNKAREGSEDCFMCLCMRSCHGLWKLDAYWKLAGGQVCMTESDASFRVRGPDGGGCTADSKSGCQFHKPKFARDPCAKQECWNKCEVEWLKKSKGKNRQQGSMLSNQKCKKGIKETNKAFEAYWKDNGIAKPEECEVKCNHYDAKPGRPLENWMPNSGTRGMVWEVFLLDTKEDWDKFYSEGFGQGVGFYTMEAVQCLGTCALYKALSAKDGSNAFKKYLNDKDWGPKTFGGGAYEGYGEYLVNTQLTEPKQVCQHIACETQCMAKYPPVKGKCSYDDGCSSTTNGETAHYDSKKLARMCERRMDRVNLLFGKGAGYADDVCLQGYTKCLEFAQNGLAEAKEVANPITGETKAEVDAKETGPATTSGAYRCLLTTLLWVAFFIVLQGSI